jgi:hypothetical protein
MKRSLLLLFAMAACTTQNNRAPDLLSLQHQAKSVCEVMASPNIYLGSRILIRGIYWQDPHNRRLIDGACPQWGIIVRESYKLRADHRATKIIKRAYKKYPTVRAPVVYSGVFASRQTDLGCSLPGCYEYRLEDAQLLSAFPPIAESGPTDRSGKGIPAAIPQFWGHQFWGHNT